MPEFRYDPSTAGSFKAWLLRLTSWRIADEFRKRPISAPSANLRKADTARTSTTDRIPDPSHDPATIWEDEWEKNLVDAAIERVKHRVDANQFQLFDLYVLQQWPVKKITQVLRVNVGRVYLAKHRITGLVRKEVAYLKKQAASPIPKQGPRDARANTP
jgi:RNA polymerase sigma-70 factor (ECF subfamily)